MISRGLPSVTIQEILQKTTEAQIVCHYLNIDSIPCVIRSPLREDKRPSFGIYATAGNHICFKDFSTHETGDMMTLLSRMWNLPYRECLGRIESDMGMFSRNISVKTSEYLHSDSSRNDSDIQVVVRDWKEHDIKYWKSYGISVEWLKFADVHPISHKIVTKNGQRYIFGAEKYAYVYVEHKDGKVTLKIYQPFSREFKWCTNIDRSVWSLWTKIPERGDMLFISSSLKDCLNLWANTGIPAICMQGEGYLPKPQIMDKLKSRFRRIVVFYDNDFTNPDNPGRKDSISLCEEYGLERIEVPEEYGCKDPSDLYRKYKRRRYLEIVRSLLESLDRNEPEDKECQSEAL